MNIKYGETKTYTSNTRYPSLYANQKGAGVNVAEVNASTIAQPDISKGNDPYEESKPIATTEPTTDNTLEKGNPLTVTNTWYDIGFNSKYYGDAAKVFYYNRYYWVAARYVVAYSDRAVFGLHYSYANRPTMIESNGNAEGSGDSYFNGYPLRPVVSLPVSLISDVKDDSGAWNLIK